jgi:hypothetical protein
MALCGAFNLKNSGSPGWSAEKFVPEPGFQKFTSSIGGSIARR